MNEQKNAKKIKELLDQVMSQQKDFSKTLQELEKVNIELCGYRTNIIHVFTMKALNMFAKIYEKEIEFIPFDLEDSVFEIEGYFHVNDTKIFALGKKEDLPPQAKEKYLKDKETANER